VRNHHSRTIICFASFFDCSAPPPKKERLILALSKKTCRKLPVGLGQPRKAWEKDAQTKAWEKDAQTNVGKSSRESFHGRRVSQTNRPLYAVTIPTRTLTRTVEEAGSIRGSAYQHPITFRTRFTHRDHDAQLAAGKQSHASYHTSHFTQFFCRARKCAKKGRSTG